MNAPHARGHSRRTLHDGTLASALLAMLAAPVAGQITRVSVATGGAQAVGGVSGGSCSVSANGRFVLFTSSSTNLVPLDTNSDDDVFLRDVAANTTQRLSVSTPGFQANDESGSIQLSPDARYALFASRASNLVVGDTNQVIDGFIRDRMLGSTQRVTLSSSGGQIADHCSPVAMSSDARFVVFGSFDPSVVPGDTNGAGDAFLRDRQLATTERISLDAGGAEANDHSYPVALSADGRFVAFISLATDIVPGDTNGMQDLFLRDRWLGTNERISVSSSGAQLTTYGVEDRASMSDDVRYISFTTRSSSLVTNDLNAHPDVFVRDRWLGTTILASRTPAGFSGNHISEWSRLTADGRFVCFTSLASNLVPGDTIDTQDVFLRDLRHGSMELVSADGMGAFANGHSSALGWCVSPDARFVAFTTWASLVPADTNGGPDVYLRERLVSVTSFCSGDGSAVDHTTACPCGNNGLVGRGCAHSFDPSGALLDTSGSPAYDDLVLHSHATPAASFTLFLEHDAQGDTLFHDGVLCASGTLVRLRGRAAVAGEASFPDSAFAQDATITLSQRVGVFPGDGVRRYYSAWYRNASTTFCPPATANVTNGLIVDW